MDKEPSILGMEMPIKGNMWMDYPKDMVNILGMIKVTIKVILSKVFEMAMVFGAMEVNLPKDIRAIIAWIKSLDMECTNGKMDGYTKETLIMIWEMDLDSYIIKVS